MPQEYEESLGGDPVLRTGRVENARETTIGEVTRQLGLEQYDRICYLYECGDEWRFYAILKEVISDESSKKEPLSGTAGKLARLWLKQHLAPRLAKVS